MNKNNIEMFYDVLDESAMLLYEKLKMTYLDGILDTANNILAHDVDYFNLSEEDNKSLMGKIEKIKDISFTNEEIRKAFQLALLKAFKHQKILSSEMTPDTIGLLISYLINKFGYKGKIKLLDPLVGTGNLLYTVANNIEVDSTVYGIDNNETLIKVANVLREILNIDGELYFDDTRHFNLEKIDIMVSDVPYLDDVKYDVLISHINDLKDLGYALLVIDNDYFMGDNALKLKEKIFNKISVLGLIKLPDSIFKEKGKSIFILRKNESQIKLYEKVLICDLPSFTDVNEFNKVINQIDYWFLENQKEY